MLYQRRFWGKFLDPKWTSHYFEINFEKTSFEYLTKVLIFLYLLLFDLAALAQLVEQRTENPCVPGSIPGGGKSWNGCQNGLMFRLVL